MVSSKKHNLKRILAIAFVIVVCFGFANTVAAATATPSRALGLDCFPEAPWYDPGAAILSAVNGLPCVSGWAISNLLITGSSVFMFLTSILFNGIISYTIVNLASHIGSSPGSGYLYPSILAGWKTFRDLGNIFFIFILLYIAISTILRLNGSDTKKLLTSVIIVALLVNFSMFFAEVIIDGTNILSLTFLSKITVTGKGNTSLVASAANYADGGLASAYLQNLGLGNFYGPPAATNSQPQGTANSSIPAFNQDNWMSVLFTALLTAIVMFVVGDVLLISSILFIIRYVVFIFLLILSPLAFVGSILPKTKAMISDKWWKTLFDQSLFAPIYFMLSWATIKIMQGVVGNSPKPINIWGLFKAGGAGSAANDVANILINYLIIIVMLITTLVISKSMASSGGDAVKKTVDWASGKAGGLYTRSAMRASYAGTGAVANVGRLPLQGVNALSRGVARAVTGKKFENWGNVPKSSMSLKNDDRAFSESAFGNTGIGRAIREATTGAAMTSKLGGGKSIADIEKEKKTANDKYAKSVDEATENQKADLRAQKVGATPERRAELDKQIAEVQDRVNRGSPLTSAEKNSKHYQDHLLEQAKKLEGKHKLLQSGARKAAAKQMRDKWRGKKSSAEEILSSFAASTTPPATPTTPPAGGTPHTP